MRRGVALAVVLLFGVCCGSAHAAQRITVVNQAAVPAKILHRVERAIGRQSWQLAYWWHTQPIDFGPGGWKVYLKHVDSSGVVGWHSAHLVHLGQWDCVSSPNSSSCVALSPDATINWVPFAHVVTHGMSWHQWSMWFSHEVVEMVVNPVSDGVHHEICDPVWWESYLIDGVRVSNFVLPDGRDLLHQ